MDLDGYDFLDLGAREGGSLRMAQTMFGGQGLGVDIDAKNVETLRSKGFHGLVADATDLPLEDNSVRFCQALHFIEHLPDADVAEKVIDQAIRVARDFVLVLGPDFGGKTYLNQMGLQKYFATWNHHPWQHTAQDFNKILQKHSQYRWSLIQFDIIRDSFSPVIVPAGMGANQKRYDPAAHGDKPWVQFKPKIFEHLAFAVVKNADFSPEDILFRAMKPKVFAESGFSPLYERADRQSARRGPGETGVQMESASLALTEAV